MSREPEVTGYRELGQGRFIRLGQLEWRDADGATRQWEVAERVEDHGAVLIIPWLRPSEKLVLIRQYRPPARCFVYEFPAGLVDAGEDPCQAARRELREETGYIAAKVKTEPLAYTTPGLSNESVHMVQVWIDEDSEENRDRQTHFDDSENIETILVAKADLGQFYREQCAGGHAFDAKLAAYIAGLCLADGTGSP